VDDAEMAVAHERYSGIPGTTDVLTFDLREPGESAAEPAQMDVDLYVCVDEARRQAAGRGHAVERELLLYIVHGVLHCLGEDDHDDATYARMHAREDEVLQAIGVGRVFDVPARSAGSDGGAA
jgi:probable rRNA maturation factor